MTLKRTIAVVAMLILGIVNQPLAEAQRNRDRDRDKGKKGKEEPIISLQPRPASKEEMDAFTLIQNEPIGQNRVTLSDDFLAKFPTSELRGFAYRFKMETLARMGKYKDVVPAAEAAMKLEMDFYTAKDQVVKEKNTEEFKKFMADTSKARLYYMQNIMNAYQQTNEAVKTIESGERILEDHPDDLLALLTVSSVMAERPSTDEKEKEKQMKRAEEVGKNAMAQVTAMAPMLPPDQKSSLMSSVHATLGLVYLNMKKYGDAQKEYLQSISFKKDDPVAYFRLGLSYAQDKPAKTTEAMEALAKSVFLKGITEAQAKDILTQIYQVQKKSLDGLDEFIKNAGAKITASQ